jgi:hypothetical protein
VKQAETKRMLGQMQEHEEASIRYGLETLGGRPAAERFTGLLALRTVAHHLDLHALFTEIDGLVKAEMKALGVE